MSRTEQPARVTAQRLEEMRKTCVANTLPPATNELPPWNPIYANLYIMEVKEVSLGNDQSFFCYFTFLCNLLRILGRCINLKFVKIFCYHENRTQLYSLRSQSVMFEFHDSSDDIFHPRTIRTKIISPRSLRFGSTL